MSSGNGQQLQAGELLLDQTLKHLGALLEIYHPQIRAGSRITAETPSFRIIIEPRLVLHSGTLVVPGRG